MKITKETIIGSTIVIIVFAAIGVATGIYGIFYIGLAFIIAVFSINLFSRKSIAAKTGAVVINTDLIYKLLIPKKFKKAIEELENKEEHK